MMKKLAFLACLSSFTFAMPVQAQAEPATDPLSRMFLWWDQAFKTPGGFTAEAFSRYFTPDATLTLEGHTVVRGVDQWVTHFRKIQASGSQVEIVVPFKHVFRQGDNIYTYHVIRSRRDGKTGCVLAAGHAVMKGPKIAAITLVRMPMDPAKGPLDPQCWTD
jgi:hypothetical protein